MSPDAPVIVIGVRLFAAAREAAGSPTIAVHVPAVTNAGRVWDHLPAAVRATINPGATRIAVNGEWAGDATRLADGDEVALITPVSGGCA